MKNKVFLQTTALEEFQLDGKSEVLLGEWCKKDLNDKREVFPYLWNNSDKILNAMEHTNKYYEEFLDILKDELNRIHNIKKDKQYYRIILGNWLLYYINSSYDRFITVRLFYKKYGKFDAKILDETLYYTPIDFNDYVRVLQTDEYNLQIYSKVIKYFFKSKRFENYISSKPLLTPEIKLTDLKSCIKNFSYIITNLTSYFTKNRILITKPYFGEKGVWAIIKLLIFSKFKIILDERNLELSNYSPININNREAIKSNTNNLFKDYLLKNIMLDIPKLYIEDFKEFRLLILNSYNTDIKQIYTSIGMHIDNRLKFFVAEHYSSLTVFSHQHGGTYGTSLIFKTEEYEESVSTYFLTAGWQDDHKTIPFGIPKLSKPLKIIQSNNIFYISTSNPKYLIRFELYVGSSYYLKEFFIRMENILINLKLQNFYIRPYPNEYSKYRITEIINRNNLDIKLDSSKNMSELFSQAKLIILDHMGTTMLESLHYNIPTIVILDPNIERFRENSLEIMANLEKNKMMFFDIAEATNFINNISNNVDNWWLSDDVQNARNKFVEKYAHLPDNWEKKLIDLLFQLSKNKS